MRSLMIGTVETVTTAVAYAMLYRFLMDVFAKEIATVLLMDKISGLFLSNGEGSMYDALTQVQVEITPELQVVHLMAKQKECHAGRTG